MIRNLCCKCRDSYQAELRLIISRSLYVIMIRLSARISTIASVGICTHRLPRKIAQGFSRFELFQSLSCFEAAWLACTVSRSFTVCTRMSSLLDPNKIMADKQRVCIVGSGNWYVNILYLKSKHLFFAIANPIWGLHRACSVIDFHALWDGLEYCVLIIAVLLSIVFVWHFSSGLLDM